MVTVVKYFPLAALIFTFNCVKGKDDGSHENIDPNDPMNQRLCQEYDFKTETPVDVSVDWTSPAPDVKEDGPLALLKRERFKLYLYGCPYEGANLDSCEALVRSKTAYKGDELTDVAWYLKGFTSLSCSNDKPYSDDSRTDFSTWSFVVEEFDKFDDDDPTQQRIDVPLYEYLTRGYWRDQVGEQSIKIEMFPTPAGALE